LGKKLFLSVLVAICLILPLTIPAYAESNIVILEVEPNPAGTDAGNEWVRLFNPSSNSINLSGWQISSTHGNTNTYTLSGNIGACDDTKIIFPSQFIDNEDESLFLYDNIGNLVDLTPIINDKDNDASTWKISTPSCESSQPEPPLHGDPEPEYLANGCPVGYPYIWSDGFCYSVPEPTPYVPFIFVDTDRFSYEDGDTVTISGEVDEFTGQAIGLKVVAPNGNIITIAALDVRYDKTFSTKIAAGGSLWESSGLYTVFVLYGSEARTAETIFYFEGSQQLSVCGPNQVFQLGQCVDIFVPTPTIPVSTTAVSVPYGTSVPGCEETNSCFLPSKITVDVGATVTWFNDDNAAHTVTAGDMGVDAEYVGLDFPNGFDSSLFMAGTSFDVKFNTAGTYPYFCMVHPWMTGVVIVKGASSGVIDTVPPLVLVPSDMTVDASDSSSVRVNFSVKAIDDNDGILRPNCSPSSGSLFPIGKTTVTCSAADRSGNSDKKSFVITVNAPDVLIPSWIRDVAGFWCNNDIDDNAFIEAIEYLIDNDVIVVQSSGERYSGSEGIPNWIKSNACWWSQGSISNNDFASGLQYLIEQGIIQV